MYDYLTGNFSSTGTMKSARQHHRTVLLYTGKVLVTGGRPIATTNVLDSAELYDPVSGSFQLNGKHAAVPALASSHGTPQRENIDYRRFGRDLEYGE